MTCQTTVLFSILIPKDVAATEPEIPIAVIELHLRPIVIHVQDFPNRELRAAVLFRAVEERTWSPGRQCSWSSLPFLSATHRCPTSSPHLRHTRLTP